MKKIIMSMIAVSALFMGGFASDAKSKTPFEEHILRVEPLSWWVGMNTPLQIMVYGPGISEYSVSMCKGTEGVEIKSVHKADSPNYLFLDMAISSSAEPGVRYFQFSKGREHFKMAYSFEKRKAGSSQRKSFTTADMIYLIMPDRFANGDPSNDSVAGATEKADRSAFFGRHGGDLKGIIDHLDYIADLGATAVWCTPLLLDNEAEQSYHGYACADYYHIDPRFGTNEQYRCYVESAHSKGLKVIMDLVTNHCGAAHWWMKDLPFKDWVHQFPEFTRTNVMFSTNMDPNASKYDLYLQESGWFDTSMPDMNLDNPFILQYFKQWAVWWIEWSGLDGLRVDTYPYNEKVPMSEWCKSVIAEYPNMNIVGECWTSSPSQLAYWQGGNENKDGFNSHLPSIMDFPLRDALCSGLPSDSPSWGEGMMRVYDALSNDFVYHDLSRMMIFWANHDTERIGDMLKGNKDRMKISMAMLATMRGIPQMFCGDEMMFRSKDLSQGHGGLRVDFPGGWLGDDKNLFTSADRNEAQSEILDYTRTLFNWRKGKEVIHSGKTLHFGARDNTYAYFRYNDTDAVFVFVNNSRGRKAIPWSHYAEITSSLKDGRDVISGQSIEINDTTIVPSRTALVVEYKRK